MMKNNFTNLLKEEMVNRFESIVKNEIREKTKFIQDNLLVIENLKKDLRACSDDYQKLKNLMESLFKSISDKFVIEKNEMNNIFKEHKESNFFNINKFSNLLNGFSDKIKECVNLKDYETQKKDGEFKLEKILKSYKDNFDNLQLNFEKLYSDHLDRTVDFHRQTSNVCDSFSNKLNDIEDKFNRSIVEIKGIFQEIQVYKKSMYIIEKKIENIYTLIERLQKKDELCLSKA